MAMAAVRRPATATQAVETMMPRRRELRWLMDVPPGAGHAVLGGWTTDESPPRPRSADNSATASRKITTMTDRQFDIALSFAAERRQAGQQVPLLILTTGTRRFATTPGGQETPATRPATARGSLCPKRCEFGVGLSTCLGTMSCDVFLCGTCLAPVRLRRTATNGASET